MNYSTVKELLKMMDKHNLVHLLEEMGEKALEAAVSLGVSWNIYDDFNYEGRHDSDEEFVKELLDGTGDIPHDLPSYIYIDWERTARDIMMDYSVEAGHYFRNV